MCYVGCLSCLGVWVFLYSSLSITFHSNIISSNWCVQLISTFSMAPKIAKTKTDAKGKGKASSSSTTIETSFHWYIEGVLRNLKRKTSIVLLSSNMYGNPLRLLSRLFLKLLILPPIRRLTTSYNSHKTIMRTLFTCSIPDYMINMVHVLSSLFEMFFMSLQMIYGSLYLE